MVLEAGFWTDVDPATAAVAVAVAMLLAVLLALVMSPAGRPAPRRRRAGGFSRAIADRAGGEGGAQ